MPTVAVKLYSVFFKLLLKRRLQTWIQSPDAAAAGDLIPSGSPADIHIDPLTSLSIRIFLPESVLLSNPSAAAGAIGDSDHHHRHPPPRPPRGVRSASDPEDNGIAEGPRRSRFNNVPRRSSYGGNGVVPTSSSPDLRRRSYDGSGLQLDGTYRGYLPSMDEHANGATANHRSGRRLPVMLQFHGGAFVSGSNDSVANDFFCRRIAKLCDMIVIAVGYRLAPESKYPAAFDDGFKVLNWVAKQANLAECSKSMGNTRKLDLNRHVVDAFGASMVEPWLASHGDPSRFFIYPLLFIFFLSFSCLVCSLGVSSGGNIADFVARKAVEAGQLLAPVKVVAQVLMYPFFIGSVSTHSEIKLANSYFFDKSMCTLAWKLFLPKEEFSLDHPAANPLHDWMRDRAIAYSEELRKVNVDAPVLDYKDAVHEFATLDMLLKTPLAQACVEDIAIWIKKYISIRGHEFSY
ncbi:unnamed protein product [Spirodela intermedia]|uniref:Alpha/beta hydrolase fold-3 domain-containing protein n=1 Tax=Spirodela intermedia TaxID=51605 RepID=A0A7I8IP40_SPIIN|nr:unnamed protein product [Spirodela intermedia]CAA6659666.1 unnamed protein product [Spirodela intermedia]